MSKFIIALLIASFAILNQCAWVEKTAVADWTGTFIVVKASCSASCSYKLGSEIKITPTTGATTTKTTWAGTAHSTDSTDVTVASGTCKYVTSVASGTPAAAADILKDADECVVATGICTTQGQKQTTAGKINFKRDMDMATKPFQTTYKQLKVIKPKTSTTNAAAADQTADCVTEADMVDTALDAKDIVGTLKLTEAACGSCSWDTSKELKISQHDSSKKYMVTLAGTIKGKSAVGDCTNKLTATEKCYAAKKDANNWAVFGCTTLQSPVGGIPIVKATASGKTTLTMAWQSGSDNCKVVGEVTSTSGSNALRYISNISMMLIIALALLFK
uniref:Agglutination/immobilization antigen n=1 Tax=Cryptocaryon irritans TaxID=153251 RepID=B1Q4I2_9CILI|nr:agglutination/immobilization antigen [Cryptocaryon irritans]